MKTIPVEKLIEEVRESAETMHAAKPEVISTASVGDVVRQGDLYFVCLESEPSGSPTKERQLAPGTTQGSRHVAKGKCRVLTPKRRAEVVAIINRVVKGANVQEELVGPVIRCIEAVTIEHPEHGWRTLPADTLWATVFQRAYGEEVRRVQD